MHGIALLQVFNSHTSYSTNMSNPFVPLLLILLISLSNQARGSARRLLLSDDTARSQHDIEHADMLMKSFNGSEEEVDGSSSGSLVVQSIKVTTKEIKVEETRIIPRSTKKYTRLKLLERAKKESSSAGLVVKIHQSMSMVPWHVPGHDNIDLDNPVFDIDYAPPKIHPPSHN